MHAAKAQHGGIEISGCCNGVHPPRLVKKTSTYILVLDMLIVNKLLADEALWQNIDNKVRR